LFFYFFEGRSDPDKARDDAIFGRTVGRIAGRPSGYRKQRSISQSYSPDLLDSTDLHQTALYESGFGNDLLIQKIIVTRSIPVWDGIRRCTSLL
jgi:hypothetical protein